MAIEQPRYEVERSADGVEFRRYESYQVAECDLREVNDISRASSAGFQYLFNYISGENEPQQKVSMTAPVQQLPNENGGWRVSFVVPRSFYATGAPVPSNSRVSIREVPAGLVAALRYKGFWGTDTFNQHKTLLLKKLAEQGVQPVGEVFSALYNPPFTPPFLRRNEVLVRIAE